MPVSSDFFLRGRVIGGISLPKSKNYREIVLAEGNTVK